MGKYNVGARVKIHLPGTKVHGKMGTVTGPEIHGSYRVAVDNMPSIGPDPVFYEKHLRDPN